MDMPSLQQINNTAATPSASTALPEKEPFWGKDGFTFGDVIDMFNPLQHLPFVAKYYREQTDDDACEGSKLIGGALFGGLFGGASGILSSIANSAVRHETHQDVSEHLLEIADVSSDNLAEGALHTFDKGSLNPSYTVAEAFLNSGAEEHLSASLHTPETPENTQKISSQPALFNNTVNPFFAQLLDEYSNEQSYSLAQQSASSQRSREWGKV